MDTCGKKNDCFDEYDYAAEGEAKRSKAQQNLVQYCRFKRV
jgi:hypothetical protein